MSKTKWQEQGGKLEIPEGFFVYKVDFDDDEPYIIICDPVSSHDARLPVPKSLAYYLSTHFCGSNVMRNLIRDNAKRELQSTIKDALGL
jgi:hypothetical protein